MAFSESHLHLATPPPAVHLKSLSFHRPRRVLRGGGAGAGAGAGVANAGLGERGNYSRLG